MTDWILICNNSMFDIERHFQNTDYIVWRQLKYCMPGDYAFFYLSAPYSSIRFVCQIEEINIHDAKRVPPFYLKSRFEVGCSETTNLNYMQLKLKRVTHDLCFSRKALIENGINCFQKSCKASEKLSEYLHSLLVLD